MQKKSMLYCVNKNGKEVFNSIKFETIDRFLNKIKNLDDYTISFKEINNIPDLNEDGIIDLADLAKLASNFGKDSLASFVDGDINGDGVVDLADLAKLSTKYGYKAGNNVGMNLYQPAYYHSEIVFNNLILQASSPISSNKNDNKWSDGREIKIDGSKIYLEDDQCAKMLIFRTWAGATKDYIPEDRIKGYNEDGDPIYKGMYPSGSYILTWDGSGSLDVEFDAKNIEYSDNVIKFDVEDPSTAGICIEVLSSDNDDPVNNIDLRFANNNDSSLYYKPYVEELSKYATIRFMDWGLTNNSEISKWDERKLPNNYGQAEGAGVAYENMIELCNVTNTNMWVCVPHLVDDEYVKNLMQLILDKLNDDLVVYVEYSNEVWNGGFKQSQWAYANGQVEELSDNYYGYVDNYYVKKCIWMFDIVNKVFKDNMNKVVRVIANQAVGVNRANRMFEAFETVFNVDYKDYIDSFAIAPYFNSAPVHESDIDLDAPQEEINKTIMPSMLRIMTDVTLPGQLNNAIKWGVELVAYEGGPHWVPPRPHDDYDTYKYTKVFYNLVNSKEMEEAYDEYLRLWFEATDGVFCCFSHTVRDTRWGNWGIHNHYTEYGKTGRSRVVMKHLGLM